MTKSGYAYVLLSKEENACVNDYKVFYVEEDMIESAIERAKKDGFKTIRVLDERFSVKN